MTDSLRTALERDHHDIDAGFEAIASGEELDTDRRAALAGSIDGLRRHIWVEEELLFPPLRDAGLFGPVMVMLREHAALWQTLDRLEQSLRAADDDLPDLCTELLALLATHNVKEEAILYPQADTAVTGEDATRLLDALADGPLPEGWTAQLLRS